MKLKSGDLFFFYKKFLWAVNQRVDQRRKTGEDEKAKRHKC